MGHDWEKILKNKSNIELYDIYLGMIYHNNKAVLYAEKELKSRKIDEKTKEIIQDQGFILLGLDGQDPGGDAPSIWCFMDLVSGRILATRKFDSLVYKKLRETIEEIEQLYGVEIIGWVSDKQNVITKCHDEYYSDIPHQFCQFHFQ